MNYTVVFDWKLVVAIGGAASMVILALKIDPDAAENVSIHAVDSLKEFGVACFSGR